MQDDRAGDDSGGGGEEQGGGVRSDRQRDLAAKSLLHREFIPATNAGDEVKEEGNDVDRRP